MILDRKVIAMTYLKGWFVLDFVSTVPWSRIVDALSEGGGPMVTVAKLAKVSLGLHGSRAAWITAFKSRSGTLVRLKFIRIIRLMKMLRAKKLKDIWEQVERRIGSVAIVQGMMCLAHGFYA